MSGAPEQEERLCSGLLALGEELDGLNHLLEQVVERLEALFGVRPPRPDLHVIAGGMTAYAEESPS